MPAAGFTLLELSIVIVILVAVMAIAWPRMRGRLQRALPQQAALQLKADLALARERAIVTGETWTCRYEPGGGKYQLGSMATFRALASVAGNRGHFLSSELPDGGFRPQPTTDTRDSPWTGTAVIAGDAPPGPASDPPVMPETRELPAGVVFRPAAVPLSPPGTVANEAVVSQSEQATATRTPRQATSNDVLQNLQPEDPWAYAVVFHPDGRADDREIRLEVGDYRKTIAIKIRGLTGAVSMGPVENQPLQTSAVPVQHDVPRVPPENPAAFPQAPPIR